MDNLEKLLVNWASRKDSGKYYGILEAIDLLRPVLDRVYEGDLDGSLTALASIETRLETLPYGHPYPKTKVQAELK